MSSPSLSLPVSAYLHKESDRLRLLLSDLTNSLFVEDKLRFYKRILSRTKRSLSFFDMDTISKTGMNSRTGLLPAGLSELFMWKSLRNKKAMLEQMIQVASQLLNRFDEGGKIFLLKLENELMEFLEDEDRILEFEGEADFYVEDCTPYLSLVRERIKNIKVRLGLLLKKIYARIYRDLRRQIRFVMRLLLPASDDDADVTNVVVSADSISLCNNLNHHHGKKGNSRTLMFG